MLKIRTSVDLASTGLQLRAALDAAAAAGAEAVVFPLSSPLRPEEITRTAVREIRKLLEDRRLRVSAVHFPTRYGYENPIQLDRRIDATKQAMEVAYALGTHLVINRLGDIPDDDDTGTWTIFREVLLSLARHGERTGATLVAETGSESGAELARLFERLPEGAFGANLHLANLAVHGHDPLETIAAVGDRILHVHATDAARRSGGRSGRQVPLGQGDLDFPAILGALEEYNYRGYFAVQVTGHDPRRELAESVAFLKRM